MEKERTDYLKFLPVSSEKVADLLKTDAVWEALLKVRESGNNGITVGEMCKELHEPQSTIYNAIKELTRIGFVLGIKESTLQRKKWGRPGKEDERRPGKSPKRFFEPCELKSGIMGERERAAENPWGDIRFSKEFDREIVNRMRKDKEDLKIIHNGFKDYIEKFCKERLKAPDSDLKKVLPNLEVCPRCERSHEATELMKAMVLYLAADFLDSDDFQELVNDYQEGKC